MKLQVKPIVPQVFSFHIRGVSPLIHHAWSEKGLRQMRMTAAERKKQPKVARDPQTEAAGAMYILPDGSPAFPMLAFKTALISAAHKDLGIEKTLVKKAIFIPSRAYEPGLLARLKCSEPHIREDIVRVGAAQTDLRYRPQFDEWQVNVVLEVDTELLSEQDIINLVNRAGFSVGVGEWRPEKGGEYGRFEFDTSLPMQAINLDELEEAA